MAFDLPLDADRVDGLNFVSILTRAPVIGTLVWILGGDKDEDKENQLGEELPAKAHSSNGGSHTGPASGEEGVCNPPRMVYSEVSNFEIAELDDSSLENEEVFPPSVDGKLEEPTLKKCKKFSWSDDNGRRLVEYQEESSVKYEPSSSVSSASTKPIKSALRRSATISSDANNLTGKEPVRYIPNGLSQPHNGIIMPSGPHGTSHGVDSPQWGWYITPPTPEMYQSYPSRSKSTKSEATNTCAVEAQAVPHTANKVFQDLQSSSKRPMGWTGVPI